MAEIPGQGPEGEAAKGAQEYYARQFTREGQAAIEVLSEAVEKKQLIHCSREYLAMFEDMSLHPDGSISEYRIGDTISIVADRKSAMDHTIQDLKDLGFIPESYDGSSDVVDFTFPGYAYTKREEPVKIGSRRLKDKTGEVVNTEENWGNGTVFVVGTDNQRMTLRDVLTKVQAEMVAREDMVKKLRWVWNQTENLEGLVQFYFMGSLTNESMDTLCNAEGRINGLKATEGGAEYREGHEFGDATSVALQCLELAALSEKPKEFEELVKSLGIKFLFRATDQEIDDIFLAPADRENRNLKPELVKWLGEPWTWKKGVRNGKVDMVSEKRGLLTEKGNILVKAFWTDAEYLFTQIERFLGGGPEAKRTFARKDARDARFEAWGFLRVSGMASDMGGQKYHVGASAELRRPEGDYIHHEMGGMTSCDRVKVIAPEVFRQVYRYLKPENRAYGPDGSLGKYPDRFTVPYLKTWTIKTEFGERTFDEMRWGYRARKEKDLVTGEFVNLPEEPAFRMGELEWKKLHPKTYNQAALGPFIAGREKIGLFQYVMNTAWRMEELKDPTFWEKFGANMGISINEQTVFNGRLRGLYNGIEDHDEGARKASVLAVRNYKKQFLRAFWDGLRSLPQWREWLSSKADHLDRGGSSIVAPLDRVKYYLKKVGILTPQEVDALPMDPWDKDNRA